MNYLFGPRIEMIVYQQWEGEWVFSKHLAFGFNAEKVVVKTGHGHLVSCSLLEEPLLLS